MASLTHGPYLLWAKDQRIVVWSRLDGPGTVEVQVGALSASATVDSSTDYMSKVSVVGLEDGAELEYSLYVDSVLASGPHTFQMLPASGSPGAFQFFAEFDHHEVYDNYAQVLPRIRSGIPSLSVIGGDFEDPGNTVADFATVAARRTGTLLRRVSAYTDKQSVRQILPMMVTWDDWDAFGNNRAGETAEGDAVAVGQQVWREFYEAPWAQSDAIYFSTLVCDCLFVFLDERTYRDASFGSEGVDIPPSFDYTQTEFLGPEQLAWLKQTLLDNQEAPFKFVISGTSWIDHASAPRLVGAARRDSIGLYYRKERNDLMHFLEANLDCARGLLLLNGDDHHPAVRYPNEWREPIDPQVDEPSDGEVVSTARIAIVKPSGFSKEQIVLGSPWADSPFNIIPHLKEQTFGHVKVNTRANPPRCDVEIVEATGGTRIYRFHGVDGQWFFPQYISAASYADQSDPSTSWTQQPDPP